VGFEEMQNEAKPARSRSARLGLGGSLVDTSLEFFVGCGRFLEASMGLLCKQEDISHSIEAAAG